MKKIASIDDINVDDFVSDATQNKLIALLDASKKSTTPHIILMAARLGVIGAQLLTTPGQVLQTWPNADGVEAITDLRLSELNDLAASGYTASAIRHAIRSGVYATVTGRPVEAVVVDFSRQLAARTLRHKMRKKAQILAA